MGGERAGGQVVKLKTRPRDPLPGHFIDTAVCAYSTNHKTNTSKG